MLTSHACRQAQALSIHVQPSNASPESWQRQLTLFWTLFVVEKWCALAFGRPCFLPSALYQHVPTPRLEHLTGFKPHLRDPSTGSWESTSSDFGAHVFLQYIELARLTGTILDSLGTDGSLSERAVVKTSLDSWYQKATEVCFEPISPLWPCLTIPGSFPHHDRRECWRGRE